MVGFGDIALEAGSSVEPFDLARAFAHDAPVELEIGCGKAAFLLRRARAHPERNFLGIEWANEFYKFAADRMARWGLANVRIMRTDARHFVIHRLPAACLAALHIYHPDPWPKKRHHKRRLFNAEFVEAAVRALRVGGRMSIQTDHAEYFSIIESLTRGHAGLAETAFADAEFGTGDERTETNFEVKYLREGRAIYRIAFERKLERA